ncbi:putative mfs transporter protein [Neofusicoccum parvum UCRNP2]|uniref:Putative mfs transporter protein n=1 Tax=Botryosphaeria parva (strain UCR-NP2) TaxID=1287680 RepID=R1FXI5_BOTPV|nr:putative mfs transporter protein [Neofusicoccum parvum UCRNP2]
MSEKRPATDASGEIEPAVELAVDGGYGWICVIAVFLVNAHTWGISTAYSVFLSYYNQSSPLQGSSPLHYALIGGLQFSQPFIVAPVATRIIGLFGMRVCLLAGVVLQTASLVGASYASAIWQLYLSQAIGFGWANGFLFTGTQYIVPQWFTRRRSLANGLAATGTGAGGMLYSLLAGHMITSMGVGWAIRTLAIAAGCVNLVCSLLLRDRNDAIEPTFVLFDPDLFKKPIYLMLLGFSFFNMLGEIIILTQIPDFGSSVLALDGNQVSVVGAMVALGQIIGRSAIGYLSDKLGRLNVASTVTFLAGIWTLAIWTNATSYDILIFYSICIGAFA